jgi:tight adherence protein B
MPMQSLAIFVLVALAAGGVIWVFVYPILSGERKAERRQETITRSEPAARVATGRTPKVRREQVEETLKELELREKKAKNLPLPMRIAQAGLSWSKRQFIIVSVVVGAVMFVGGFLTGGGILVAAGLGFAGGVGLPRWMLGFLKTRREANFLHHFPDAVDVIVRGVKAGLPLGDCLRIIASEAQEPVRSEFKAICEAQTIGIPMGDACAKLFERMPLPEANFFGIVVSIQQRSGGNLSEALGNLSRVLRDRKKMKAKITAMSQEAKASAAIIGSLPFVIMGALTVLNPAYLNPLWDTTLGNIMVIGSGVWMVLGILVMRKMINFDF